MNRKKILFLGPRWPYPVVGGDRVKPYNLLRYLGSAHEVHFVSLVQGERDEEELDAIRKLGIFVYPIPLNPTVQSYKVLLGAIKGLPLEISYYDSRTMHKIVDRLISKHTFHLAMGFFMRTAEYLKDVDTRKLRRVMIAEDYRSVYMERSFNDATNTVQKMARWWEQKTLPKYEPNTLNKFDAVTFVSDDDCRYAAESGVTAPIELLTNGTDTSFFKPEGKRIHTDFEKEKTVIFTSKFDVYANELMVEKIIGDVMPRIWELHPECKLILAGANPGKDILALRSDKVQVMADVDNMADILRAASIFLHPHSGGSGIQNKLIEAMACGLAVVTTPTGNQGINGKSGENLLIGEDSEELALHVSSLLNGTIKAEQIGRSARKHIIDNLSWERVFTDLEMIIQKYGR